MIGKLVFVDGPYGLRKYLGDEIKTPRAFELYRDLFAAAVRRGVSHLVVCGTFESLAWIHETVRVPTPLMYRSTIVWHKPDWVGGAVKHIRTFSPRYELLAHYSMNESEFYADIVRQPYGPRAMAGDIKKTGRPRIWQPNPLGARCGNVWTITSERLAKKVMGRTLANAHPCQKPTELLTRIVLATTQLGDEVEEPFYGSCGLLNVCSNLGRKHTAWLRAEEYILGQQAREEK